VARHACSSIRICQWLGLRTIQFRIRRKTKSGKDRENYFFEFQFKVEIPLVQVSQKVLPKQPLKFLKSRLKDQSIARIQNRIY
jgi:hypothetical protein